MSLPRSHPNGSGHPHSHWGRSSFLNAERETGTGSLERGQNWTGHKPQGFQGPGEPAGVKYHPPSTRHALGGPWRAPGGCPSHMPREKNRNNPEHPTVRTAMCSGDPHTDVQTQ